MVLVRSGIVERNFEVVGLVYVKMLPCTNSTLA